MLPCTYQCNPRAATLISSLQKACFSETQRHIGISPKIRCQRKKKKSHSKDFQSYLNRATPENSPSAWKFAHFSNCDMELPQREANELQSCCSTPGLTHSHCRTNSVLARHGRGVRSYSLYLHKTTHIYICLLIYVHRHTP